LRFALLPKENPTNNILVGFSSYTRLIFLQIKGKR